MLSLFISVFFSKKLLFCIFTLYPEFYGLTRIEYWILCPVCFPLPPLSLCLHWPTEKPIKGWNLNKISVVFISNSYQTITSGESIRFNDFTHYVAGTMIFQSKKLHWFSMFLLHAKT